MFGTVLTSTGTASSIFGYAGEQADTYIKLLFLRARYYSPEMARFLSKDVWQGDYTRPQSLNAWGYTEGNSINRVDPSGRVSEGEKFYLRLWGSVMWDAALRLNAESLTELSDQAFASMIGAKILIEDATVFADNFDWQRAFGGTLASDLPDPLRDAVEMDPRLGKGEISWSALNIPLPLYKRGLSWWEENYSCLGFDLGDLRTSYFWYRDNWFAQWFLRRSENEFLVQELQRTQGGIEATALAMLESSSRARRYWSMHNLLPHELSAYTIALGVIQFRESDETLYTVSGWKSPGAQGDWVEAIAEAGEILGFHLAEPQDYLRYTEEEKLKLNPIR